MSPTVTTSTLPTAGRTRTETLAESVLILLSLTVLQRAIGFGRGVLFCRWLDPEQLGQWEMAFSFLNLAAPIAVLSLPGAFGRYLEHYRRRGQLRVFLRRTGIVSALLACASVGVLEWRADWFSHLIFGRDDHQTLVRLLGGCLLLVIAFNFLGELFTALRMQRMASALQMFHSTAFAAVSVGLLLGWKMEAASIIAAFSLASGAAILLAGTWLKQATQEDYPATTADGATDFWRKLLPFALAVWATNWLTNLFSLVDRYMIVHFSGLDASDALSLVGQYHTSRLVPVLIVMVANLLAAVILPHLAHSWEQGSSRSVSKQLNLILKLAAICISLTAAGVLLVAPFIFGVVFRDKFAAGLEVLPWTLSYCAWTSLACLSRSYLWCAERARLVNVAYAFGIVTNIGLNLWLLPSYGLHGAVWATSAGNVLALSLILFASRRHGMHVEGGTLLVALLPLTYSLGVTALLLVLMAVTLVTLSTEWILSREDRRQLAAFVRARIAKVQS